MDQTQSNHRRGKRLCLKLMFVVSAVGGFLLPLFPEHLWDPVCIGLGIGIGLLSIAWFRFDTLEQNVYLSSTFFLLIVTVFGFVYFPYYFIKTRRWGVWRTVLKAIALQLAINVVMGAAALATWSVVQWPHAPMERIREESVFDQVLQ